MPKSGYRRTDVCMLCQKAHEECGSSGNGELSQETIGHIQSAGCTCALDKRRWSQPRTMRASGSCYKKSMCTHGKADRHMRLLTIETENKLGTLWDQEECN
jgi:hypothetical protein